MSGIESDTLIIKNAGNWLKNNAVYCEAYNESYKLSDTAVITVKQIVRGDVNADDAFTIADVVMLQKWLICSPNASLINWRAGDLCEDEYIDVFDLCVMKRELLSVNASTRILSSMLSAT